MSDDRVLVYTTEDRELFDRVASRLIAEYVNKHGVTQYTQNLSHCFEAAAQAVRERAYQSGRLQRPEESV